jgi:hypothetical protein
MTTDAEKRLLSEIAVLAARIKATRKPGVRQEGGALQTLEAQSRAKWEQLRVLRAGPVNDFPPDRYGRSSRS